MIRPTPTVRPALTPHDLVRAVRGPSVGDSSDYDLNPEVLSDLPPGRKLRAAAVLCGIVERDEGLHVILTRRSEALAQHPGQVAFPGGKVDAVDRDTAAAALREAEEEIGLGAAHVDLIGAIDGHETVTGFSVEPFVAIVDSAFTARPDHREVAEVFEAPLDFLMDRRNHKTGWRDWKGSRRYFFEMPWNGYYIWGATARMLRGLALRFEALER